jgi:type I restriction system adenine methylase (hsdM)
MDESDPKYARFVPNEEIKVTNEYNLNIPRYIDSSEPEDLQDINAHLNGGIPETDVDSMAEYWAVYPSLKEILFQPLRPGYLRPAVDKDEVVSTITSHPEFIRHADQVDDAYAQWKETVTRDLMRLGRDIHPKELIAKISEQLLNDFSQVALLDKYDVYEVLMEYWAETMQDDVYAVCYDGYEAGREIAYEYVTKKKKENGQTIEVKTDKIKGFEGKLLPKALIAAHFFEEDVKALDILRGQLDEVSDKLEELAEENGGEDGLFAQLDDLKKATVSARIKAIKKDPAAKEELAALKEYMSLMDAESNYKKAIKQAEADLNTKLEKKYPQLTLEEIRHLLVEEKWFAAIYSGIDAIHEAVSHHLSARVTQLVERYEYTLKECEDEVDQYETKVKSHLKRMGFAW